MILDTLAVTNLGNSLIANAIAQGGKITFTRCAVGSGIGSSDIANMNDVTDEVGEYTIEAVIASDASAVVVVKEETFPEAYYLREIGLFAKLEEGSEILFAAARESAHPEYIQPGGSAARDISYTMQFTMSGAANVVVQIASIQYIRELQKGAPNGVATLDNEGKVPKEQMPDMGHISAKERGEANGVASLDENKKVPAEQIPLTRVELCRFTESGTFKPADYPTADGRYDIVLQGGGGGGASATQTGSVIVYGGAAGGYMCLTGLTLIPDKEYAVTVGKGGEALPEGSGTGSNSVQSPGNDGGDTTFWNYTVPGGKGGPLNSQPQPVTACGFTAEVGTVGDDGRGGDSHFARGGLSGTAGQAKYRHAQSGALGSGGGALTKYGTFVADTGAGGDGVVIIYGIPK